VVAIGAAALIKNTTGDYNTACGYDALGENVTGDSNTAVGYYALKESTGTECTAVGTQAGQNITSGNGNTVMGRKALYTCTTGNLNTALGEGSAYSLTTGYKNVYAGNQAGYNITTAVQSVAVGYQALFNCTTSNSNTAIGFYALVLATGNNNTAIGEQAGAAITSGAGNCCVGLDAGRSNSPSGEITTGSNNMVLGSNTISNLYCADTSISSSDARDKTDVENFTHGLSWIKELRPVTYRWDRRTWYSDDKSVKPDGSKKRDRIHIGFLAQEAIEVEKKHGYAGKKDDMLIVNQDEDEKDPSYGMKYERLVPVLVNAIKELSDKNEALEARLAALES